MSFGNVTNISIRSWGKIVETPPGDHDLKHTHSDYIRSLDPIGCIKDAVHKAYLLARKLGFKCSPALVATAANSPEGVPAAAACFSGPTEWLQDTGSPNDLVDRQDLLPEILKHSEPAECPVTLCTAGGEIIVDKQIKLQVGATREEIYALLLDDSPSVMSIGKRCMRLGFDFVWRGYSNSPYYILPDKRKVKMTVIGDHT